MNDVDQTRIFYSTMLRSRRRAVPGTLCTGIERSGSTWSYNVCRLIVARAAQTRGLRFFAGFRDCDRLDQFFQSGRDGLFVVKTHRPGPKALALMGAAKVRNVCTFRDPRDCVASKMKFQSVSFDAALHVLKGNVEYLYQYLDMRNTHFVRYEEMVADPVDQIRRIAAYHDVELAASELERIHEMTSPKTAQRVVDGLDPNKRTSYWEGTCLVDRVHLLHKNHLQGGTVGRWRSQLDAGEQRAATEAFKGVLQRLGYDDAGC